LFKRLTAMAALVLVLAGMTVLGMCPRQVGASATAAVAPEEATSLSPYWQSRIQRWTPLIVQEAQRRGLDPDLVAALIWKESRGHSSAIGPGGSVGLMQVMPKEAGFTWRPTTAELLDPNLNVFWGTRTLSIIIRQGEGDLFQSLAAYNGGWSLASLRGPTRFASFVLPGRGRAVAPPHGVDGEWAAYLVTHSGDTRGITYAIDGGEGTVALQGDGSAEGIAGGITLPSSAPLSEVALVTDEGGATTHEVNLWLYCHQTQRWVGPAAEVSLEPQVDATDHHSPGPAISSPSVMAGSEPPDDATGEFRADDTPVVAGDNVGVPPAVVGPPVTSSPATADLACGGGDLSLLTWPLDRVNTPDGWEALVYAEGRGGDCRYTYEWNDSSDVKGADLTGSLAFRVHSPRRGDPILGTVVVTSGEETVRLRLYILPPGD
jgi:hypothetical protein